MKKLSGSVIAERVKKEIADKLKGEKRKPCLAIILVGHRYDSQLYVKLKKRAATEVGIKFKIHRFKESSRQKDILDLIDILNNDENVDAILVQLPLPTGYNADEVVSRIRPEKDADGFHPKNLKKISEGNDLEQLAIPPVFGAVIEFLKMANCPVKDKRVLILANSDIFGKNLEKMLKYKGALPVRSKVGSSSFKKELSQAAVIISAIGQPNLFMANDLKDGAIVIDVGITKKGKQVVGDFDEDPLVTKRGFFTPVPGGVGPVTIAMLLKNTLFLYEKRSTKK
jgi:methylenetetrahydrofolate dehydrogenase (NADP+)/methenyltetrahydrofolate cyclohydrolase